MSSSEKLNCIIVDDELMARKSLERLCAKSDALELLSTFDNGKSAIESLESEQVDLIFLDIEMPEMTGIDLIEQLPYLPQIVFTTSNPAYAYEAYEYEVTDFLKKPVTQPRFQRAVEKALNHQKHLDNVADGSAGTEIYIKDGRTYIRIPFNNILYFENEGDYVKLLTDDKTHFLHGSLKSIEQRLHHKRFLKVHRSYIVNLDHIIDIEDHSLVIGRKVIPISRAHYPVLMKLINIL